MSSGHQVREYLYLAWYIERFYLFAFILHIFHTRCIKLNYNNLRWRICFTIFQNWFHGRNFGFTLWQPWFHTITFFGFTLSLPFVSRHHSLSLAWCPEDIRPGNIYISNVHCLSRGISDEPKFWYPSHSRLWNIDSPRVKLKPTSCETKTNVHVKLKMTLCETLPSPQLFNIQSDTTAVKDVKAKYKHVLR